MGNRYHCLEEDLNARYEPAEPEINEPEIDEPEPAEVRIDSEYEAPQISSDESDFSASDNDFENSEVELSDLNTGVKSDEMRVVNDSEYENFDSLYSAYDSDGDGSHRNPKHPEFNIATYIANPKLKCSRAKCIALEKLHGNHTEQYTKLYDYLSELRSIICLDGCHLKGFFWGHLLAAVGIDADDSIYPLAFAVVESGNQSSWFWFLKLLGNDLELNNSHILTFMTDRHKGLIEVVAELFPNTEHRTCVRHLYSNFKSNGHHKGKALKDQLWMAAKATYLREFECVMEGMKVIRDIYMSCGDNIVVILDSCWPIHAGGLTYQVSCGPSNQHCVNIETRTCSCRKWELTENFMDQCYLVKIQMDIYSNFINPVRGPNQWTPIETMEPILPPTLRRPPGRPHKNRRREVDEAPPYTHRVAKRGVKIFCRKCGGSGHNVRTYKGQVSRNTRPLQQTSAARRSKMPFRRSNEAVMQNQTSSSRSQQPAGVHTVRCMPTPTVPLSQDSCVTQSSPHQQAPTPNQATMQNQRTSPRVQSPSQGYTVRWMPTPTVHIRQ
ncbi:hypothetical protein F3Y22_tig00111506pilonHSYRG00172 [Hibiscus syriacus]|uniref:MULE transposase domain-containing protein n=1 Tax=Hibiscus syriacus TaxID=106335 RepID=A0A6A2Y251_HIBSY|nr:hypothetical protein F3Y22_tig00111506pilonHSYRG00172 [Hibiscus syriacus]